MIHKRRDKAAAAAAEETTDAAAETPDTADTTAVVEEAPTPEAQIAKPEPVQLNSAIALAILEYCPELPPFGFTLLALRQRLEAAGECPPTEDILQYLSQYYNMDEWKARVLKSLPLPDSPKAFNLPQQDRDFAQLLGEKGFDFGGTSSADASSNEE